jgi:hypothetical protein
MIAWGLLSIFQLVFLPGFLVARVAKIKGATRTMILSLGLSPIVNYLLVFFLTALGIYHRWLVLLVFGLEIIALLYLIGPIGPTERLAAKKTNVITPASLAIFMIALSSVIYYALVYGGTIKDIFTDWDAVVSWDRWAMDWYDNGFPERTWHYPQLIPANWSLTYQFIGDARVKFFAKYYMALTEVFVLLAIFVTGISKRRVGYFSATIIVAWLQWALGSRGNGYVDSAVSFLALLSVLWILLSRDVEGDEQEKYFYFGAILAAGTAVTKQSGIWMAMAYPLLFLANRPLRDPALVRGFRLLPKLLLIYAVIIATWYGFKEIQILVGRDSSEIAAVTEQIHEGRSYLERIAFASAQLQEQLTLSSRIGLINWSFSIPGILVLLAILGLLIVSCRERIFRWLLGLVIAPFTLLWMLFFSYDTRNLNMVVPLIGLMAGAGLGILIELMPTGRFLQNVRFGKCWGTALERSRFFFASTGTIFFLPVIAAIVLVWLQQKFSDEYLIYKAVAKQRQIGGTKLNEELYRYSSANNITGLILTDYQYLGSLPELSQHYLLGKSQKNEFIELSKSPLVGYVLISELFANPNVSRYFNRLAEQGKIEFIFEANGWRFLTTCHQDCG